MKRYAIKKKNCSKMVAVLNYDENKKEFTIDIPKGIATKEVPFMLSIFMKKGIHHVDSEWSMKWVQSRIVPSSRQNIGEILRINGMKSYDEHKLLLRSNGQSCQDEFYIESL